MKKGGIRPLYLLIMLLINPTWCQNLKRTVDMRWTEADGDR